MDAVEKAVEALKDEALARLIDRSWPPDAPDPMRRRVARTVLDAVDYDALLAERDRWRTKAEEEYDLAIDTLNEVLANAGEEWDGDASIDFIAVSYVRWLESERDRYRAMMRDNGE